jgi:hypothetical protein
MRHFWKGALRAKVNIAKMALGASWMLAAGGHQGRK